MKKIKWENIITVILVGLYLYDFITVKVNVYQNNLGNGMINYIFLFIGLYIVRYGIRELRKTNTIKEIKKLFID